MTRRSSTWNAWQSTITAELTSGANSVSVSSIPAEFVAPMYLVVEPDTTGQKEWIKADTINGNTFENLTRNLDGSDGDLTHPINSVIRLVLSKQHLDDIFLDIGDNTQATTDHLADAGDPHAQAGYLTEGETDMLYVRLAGSTLDSTAQIKSDTNPVVDDDLSRKGYVDSSIDADVATHTALDAAHHVRYADSEAVIATNPAARTLLTTADTVLTDMTYDTFMVSGLQTGPGAGTSTVITLPLLSNVESGYTLFVIQQGFSGNDPTDNDFEFRVAAAGSDMIRLLNGTTVALTSIFGGQNQRWAAIAAPTANLWFETVTTN